MSFSKTVFHRTAFIACMTIALSMLSTASHARIQSDTQALDSSRSQIENAFTLEPALTQLPQSWGLAVSEQALFITHRQGGISQISLADPQAQIRIAFVPDDLLTGGQGGLLDIALHPDYAKNGWIYLNYSAGTDEENALKIVRFKLEGNALSSLETVFVLNDTKDTPVHYGARMAFLPDNSLLVTTGDGFDYREQAQVLTNQLGKTLRMTDTGEPHPDNLQGYVFTYGHRNPQGLVVTAEGDIIQHEHGPAGGDEINVLSADDNYGWPVITYGEDYIGASISPFTEYEGMRQPALDWTPSIAPSGMIYYDSQPLSALSGYLLISSLKFQQIYAVRLTDILRADAARSTIKDERTNLQILTKRFGRLRDMTLDAEGRVWVLGDGSAGEADTVLFQLEKASQ